MTTSNLIKLILCLLFIFGGATLLCLGQLVAGISGVVIGIGIAATTYKK
jgi:hypothetical protein